MISKLEIHNYLKTLHNDIFQFLDLKVEHYYVHSLSY